MNNCALPSWPRERDLAKYGKYTLIDFDRELSEGKTWIDIGCRTGIALSETLKRYKARLIGVNAHPIEVLPGIKSLSAVIPHDHSVYTDYKGTTDLLTDIYGAVSYENDPLAVLIYEALLLNAGGKAVIVCLEAKLGNKSNHRDMMNFFEKVMGQQLEFKRFRHYSDNLKKIINSLRITIKGKCTSKDSLDALFSKARKVIGIPEMKKIIFTPPDRSIDMWKIVYKKNKR